MTIREYFHFLSRSAFGLGALFFSLIAAVLLLSGGFGPTIAAIGFVIGVVVLVVLGFVTGLGPRAAAAEGERIAAREAARKVQASADILLHLTALRLPEGEVSKARDLVVLEGRRFLEACAARGDAKAAALPEGPAYDPVAMAAIEEALGLVDAWQKEADETAIERRFGSGDSHPLEDGDSRVAAALRGKAALLVKGRDLVSAEIPAPDRIAIEEELK